MLGVILDATGTFWGCGSLDFDTLTLGPWFARRIPVMHASAKSDGPRYSRMDEVRRRLGSFADLCEQASFAAEAGEVEELFECSFAARQLRHAISTSHDMQVLDPQSRDIDQLADAFLASQRAESGDALLRQLHERVLPDDAALLADPIGIVALVESLLPTTWNFEEDLVILFGNGLDAPADLLGRLGQKRVCLFLPEGVEPEHYPQSVRIIRDEKDLYEALASWAPRHPARIVSRSLVDSIVTETTQRELVESAELYLGYVQVDRNTTSAFADTWLSQGIENLPKTVRNPSVATFAEDFIGKPMVIVAPGPSLAKNVALLHAIKGKAIICTFSHTLSALAAEGIDPDVVVTVDSNSLQYHFKDFPMQQVECMVSGVTVHPDLLEMPAKRHVSMGANGAFDMWIGDLLGEELLLPAGGSVATTALALGLRWKCDPILFMGLDLSFSNGQYYVETSCDGGLRVSTNDDGSQLILDGWSDDCTEMRKRGGPISSDVLKTFTLPGYYGGEVSTSQMFWLFHDWFEKKTAEVGGRTRLINCTEGGCHIEGMEHISLREALALHIEQASPFSVGEIMDARIAQMVPERRIRAAEGIDTLVTTIEKCLSLVGRCDRMAQRVLQDPAKMDSLTNLETELVTTLKQTRFMSGSRQREIAMAYERASSAEELSELLMASQDLYQQIRAAAKQVLPGLREVARTIRRQS